MFPSLNLWNETMMRCQLSYSQRMNSTVPESSYVHLIDKEHRPIGTTIATTAKKIDEAFVNSLAVDAGIIGLAGAVGVGLEYFFLIPGLMSLPVASTALLISADSCAATWVESTRKLFEKERDFVQAHYPDLTQKISETRKTLQSNTKSQKISERFFPEPDGFLRGAGLQTEGKSALLRIYESYQRNYHQRLAKEHTLLRDLAKQFDWVLMREVEIAPAMDIIRPQKLTEACSCTYQERDSLKPINAYHQQLAAQQLAAAHRASVQNLVVRQAMRCDAKAHHYKFGRW